MHGEKSGLRNTHFNRRHHDYSERELIVMDIDLIHFDYKTHLPVCIIESKHGNIKRMDFNDCQFDCLFELARFGKKTLPLFCVVYYMFDDNLKLLNSEDDFDKIKHIQYIVYPLNEEARQVSGINNLRYMSERDYYDLLYKVRGSEAPKPLKPLYDDFIYAGMWSSPKVIFRKN